ncbi:J domain-containing protein [Gangjinia marincola]|uniref:J domain-containing protein n=1 Tax=Gangjinia marincola TaxID=578463 RepID=A0ABN1MI35_9FLAO
MVKYIAAVIGFAYKGFFGAVTGYIIGSIIDTFFDTEGKKNPLTSVFGGSQQVSPGDFELNLLSLASLVIKADGSVSQTELDYVRGYFVQAYGKERANATFKTFNEVIKNREISAQRICHYLNQRTRYPVRLQIIHFLFGIAQADGTVSNAEVNELSSIAGFFRVNRPDFESIKAMFVKNSESAYKILEISSTATEAEVKQAYRTMAKKYHPDKLQNMDEAYRKGAEEKFKNVQDAYESIRKSRGFK